MNILNAVAMLCGLQTGMVSMPIADYKAKVRVCNEYITTCLAEKHTQDNLNRCTDAYHAVYEPDRDKRLQQLIDEYGGNTGQSDAYRVEVYQ